MGTHCRLRPPLSSDVCIAETISSGKASTCGFQLLPTDDQSQSAVLSCQCFCRAAGKKKKGKQPDGSTQSKTYKSPGEVKQGYGEHQYIQCHEFAYYKPAWQAACCPFTDGTMLGGEWQVN